MKISQNEQKVVFLAKKCILQATAVVDMWYM